jgi:hypothetical protein
MLGLRPATRLLGMLLFVLLLAGSVQAQAPGAAEVLFRQAVTLAKEGKYPEAIAKFQASYELDAARGTLLGWALAEQRAGKIASALAHYQQLRAEAQRAGDQEREEQATKAISQLVARVPTLTVTAAAPLPEGTELTLGTRKLPEGALGTQLPLDPGEYAVRAVAPDGARFERKITLVEGAREQVEIVLSAVAAPRKTKRPSPPPEPPPGPRSGGWSGVRTAGLVVGVAGLGALGVGAYFWFDSGKQYDNVDAACRSNGGLCPSDQRSAIDTGKSDEVIGRVLLIAGGVVATTGLTMFVFGGNSRESEAAVAVAPGSVTVRGHF